MTIQEIHLKSEIQLKIDSRKSTKLTPDDIAMVLLKFEEYLNTYNFSDIVIAPGGFIRVYPRFHFQGDSITEIMHLKRRQV